MDQGSKHTLTDCVRFGAVCRFWHSILKDNIQMKQKKWSRQHQVPLLLFHDKEEDQWSVYNVMDNKFLNLKLSLSHKRRFSGSSEGWLVVGNKNYTVTLHRPDFIAKEDNCCAGVSIDLPYLFPPAEVEPIEDLDPDDLEDAGEEAYDYRVVKALITADPLENPDNCTIVVIFGRHAELAFMRYNKDTTWMKVENSFNLDDIVHYKNKVYALGIQGLIAFDTADPSTIKCIARRFPIPLFCRRYLVESCGELLQVERLFETNFGLTRSTRTFRVFRMDFDEERWVEIKSLGGASLFIGYNTSISVLACDLAKCCSNCIYFATDEIGIRPSRSSDLGVYNVENGSFELNLTLDPTTFSRMVDGPPVWVVPIPAVRNVGYFSLVTNFFPF